MLLREPLDDGHLALVNLKENYFPRFGISPRQMSLHLSFELFPGHGNCLVHPGCTIELPSLLARNLHELARFRPADALDVSVNLAGQFLGVSRPAVIVPFQAQT